MRRLLAYRNICLYLIGQTFSLFGDTALWLAMGIWVKSLTGSNAAAGLVFFTFALPSLGAPLFGLLVDRLSRRPLLIATNLISGVVVLLLLFVHNSNDIWLIYIVMFFYGISSSLIGSSQSALLTVILPPDLLGEANSVLQTVRQGLRLVGPLIGAGLFAWLGGGAVAIIDTFTFLIAAGVVLMVHVDESKSEHAERFQISQLFAGMKLIQETKVLLQLVIACAVTLLVIGFGETVLFAVVGEGLHRPPAFLGVLLMVEGIGGLLGGLTAASVMGRAAEGILAGIGIVSLALGTAFMIATFLPFVLFGLILFGLGLPWLIIGAFTLLQRVTPSHLQGRAYSALDILTGLPQTLSIALGAGLITLVNFRWLLLMMSFVLGSAALYLLTRKEQWQRRATLLKPQAFVENP